MRHLVVLAAVLVAVAAQTASNKFSHYQCYTSDPSENMPNTLDNLVALLEKYEATSTYTNMDALAEMIVNKYRKDGIVYNPWKSGQWPWVVGEKDKEREKQNLIFAVARTTKVLTPGIFDIREECALHRMMSHSTDTFPQSGINDIWDGTINRANAGDRVKRAIGSQPTPSPPSKTMSGGVAGSISSRVYNNPGDVDLAIHPLEYGVMETAYGPVAAGTLFTGLMAINDKSEYSIKSILPDNDIEDMPSAMLSKTLSPVYAASLSGDLAQMTLFSQATQTTDRIGPPGRYHNSTTCAQQFSLYDSDYSYLSRAELNAGLDVLIMHYAYTEGSGGTYTNSLTLSQLLRMYYSEKGLPGNPNFKACNRMHLYQYLDKAKIKEQALNLIYAYQNDFLTLNDEIDYYSDNFELIEQHFITALTPIMSIMESFIGSYNYEDEGYSKCTVQSSLSGGFSNSVGGLNYGPPSEVKADLIAVYAAEGTIDQMRNQRQMIADVARRIGVSNLRSRLGVLNARDGGWMIPFGNITNIGDLACNFTSGTFDLYSSGSSGSSRSSDTIVKVLEELSIHYQEQYDLAFNDIETSSGRSLVVLWQVPSTMPGDGTKNKRAIRKFRLRFPDVSVVFVGRSRNNYVELLEDEDDFVTLTPSNLPETVKSAIARVQISPKAFMYPACNPSNSTAALDYREESHNFEGAVSPNFTTYIRIPPMNFRYSEQVEVKVTGDIRACFSRTNRLALEDYTVETMRTDLKIKSSQNDVICVGGENDNEEDTVKYRHLCDKDVGTCNPLYISITPLTNTATRGTCATGTNVQEICEFPDQIRYEMTHKGMTCGSSNTAPALALLLLLPLLLQYLQW